MAINLIGIANPETVQIPLGGQLQLTICTGIAEFEFDGQSDQIQHDTLTFTIPEVTFPLGTLISGNEIPTTASLNSIAGSGLWAVDSVSSSLDETQIVLTAELAVARQVQLRRMGYQVNILAQLPSS